MAHTGPRALMNNLPVEVVMQLNMELLFQLRELLLKIQYCLIKVILIFNLQLYCIKWSSSDH